MDGLLENLNSGVDVSDGMDAVIELLAQRNNELQAIKAAEEAKKAKRKRKKAVVEALEPEKKKPAPVNPMVDTDLNYMALAVAILAPDVVEKDKEGNPIFEIATDEKGNVIYTVDSGVKTPKKRIKTRDISVDDALHMMGLDRKNNMNKNKNSNELD